MKDKRGDEAQRFVVPVRIGGLMPNEQTRQFLGIVDLVIWPDGVERVKAM